MLKKKKYFFVIFTVLYDSLVCEQNISNISRFTINNYFFNTFDSKYKEISQKSPVTSGTIYNLLNGSD